ncbi:hypothetical protein J1614_011832 [Plenodomus biglobosus]|nr:hypothetical protein J1614_011832 [Plenodomus biglobosus]
MMYKVEGISLFLGNSSYVTSGAFNWPNLSIPTVRRYGNGFEVEASHGRESSAGCCSIAPRLPYPMAPTNPFSRQLRQVDSFGQLTGGYTSQFSFSECCKRTPGFSEVHDNCHSLAFDCRAGPTAMSGKLVDW